MTSSPVEAIDDAWKITGLELLGEQRVDPGLAPASGVPSPAPSAQRPASG
jgi:hypothetical protein